MKNIFSFVFSLLCLVTLAQASPPGLVGCNNVREPIDFVPTKAVAVTFSIPEPTQSFVVSSFTDKAFECYVLTDSPLQTYSVKVDEQVTSNGYGLVGYSPDNPSVSKYIYCYLYLNPSERTDSGYAKAWFPLARSGFNQNRLR